MTLSKSILTPTIHTTCYRLEGQYNFAAAPGASVSLDWGHGRRFHLEASGQRRQGVLLLIGKHFLRHHLRLRLPRPLRDQRVHRHLAPAPLHGHLFLRGSRKT